MTEDENTNNNPYPYLTNERNQQNVSLSNNHYDHDYLIETERNVIEIDERIIRIAAANELQARRMARISSNNGNNHNYANYNNNQNNFRLQNQGSMVPETMFVRGTDSLFYSEHSVNRRTGPVRNNDPCAQQ